ncbi:hypothetical protein EZV62_021331 [Acer yangbiense]|uniref:Jacalin-type lectin domain-containing protein n=1 Tax=Acer yangbiense TaxID=1000413 RepID=A0A5C7H6V8_9ROSI|nr:hypothetical protein EZV62_021331 [Acer yangbiense]
MTEWLVQYIRIALKLHDLLPLHSGKHGVSARVIFDYPSEILTCITGTYGVVKYTNVIKSITFHTNKGKHGPFGEEKGSSFTSNVKAGKKNVGFRGREGLFLVAIGVHVVDMDIPQWPPNKVEPTPTEHEELN